MMFDRERERKEREREEARKTPQDFEDEKFGQAIGQAMRAIREDEKEKLRKEPGKLLNYLDYYRR